MVRDPSERIETPKRWRSLPAVLTVDDVERLLAAPATDGPLAIRDRALLEFGYATGARVSELVGLKLQDILFEDGIARLFGKGAKERLVPVGRRALGQVALYAREIRPLLDKGKGKGILFLNARGTPLSRVGAWGIIKQAAKLAGLTKRVTPHTLRHTFATHLLEGGRRSSRGAGDAGARRPRHDPDLHPCGSRLLADRASAVSPEGVGAGDVREREGSRLCGVGAKMNRCERSAWIPLGGGAWVQRMRSPPTTVAAPPGLLTPPGRHPIPSRASIP